MIAGCYTLDLYCRYAPQSEQSIAPPDPTNEITGMTYDRRHNRGPAQFTHETGPGARRCAREAGWVFGRDGDVTCRVCVKHGPGYEPPT